MAIASHFTPVTIPGLARHQRGGPLVAVAGVCGGAGVSTLAFLLAYAAARASEATGVPVLCCDTGGPLGGLSVYANTTTPRTLPGLADHLAHGGALTSVPFAEGPGGMRLLAGGPKFNDSGDLAFIQQILTDARAAHGLTVVDCGTLQRPADQVAFSQATHVLWMLPATVSGARRAARALDVAPPLAARETVIARCDYSDRKPPMRELTALADSRGGALTLMPHVNDFCDSTPDETVSAAQVTLQAIAGVLR